MNPLESADHPLHQLLSPYSRKLGIEPVELGDDRAAFKMDYDQSNTTIGDLVHGGALLSLADCAITGAAWSGVTDPENYRGVTVELSCSPAKRRQSKSSCWLNWSEAARKFTVPWPIRRARRRNARS